MQPIGTLELPIGDRIFLEIYLATPTVHQPTRTISVVAMAEFDGIGLDFSPYDDIPVTVTSTERLTLNDLPPEAVGNLVDTYLARLTSLALSLGELDLATEDNVVTILTRAELDLLSHCLNTLEPCWGEAVTDTTAAAGIVGTERDRVAQLNWRLGRLRDRTEPDE